LAAIKNNEIENCPANPLAGRWPNDQGQGSGLDFERILAFYWPGVPARRSATDKVQRRKPQKTPPEPPCWVGM